MQTFRASGGESKNLAGINPCGRSVFNVFSPVVLAGRTTRVIGPAFTPFRIHFVFAFLVNGFLFVLNGGAVGFIRSISVSSPFVLIVGVLSKVLRRSGLGVNKSAWFTFMGNRIAFFVVLIAGFFHPASWAHFEGKRDFASISHTDIIATKSGDVKQGENGETPDRTIPCQAAAIKRVAEGVTTRGRAISGNAPTSALPSYAGDEIVCSAWEHAGASDKEPRTTGGNTPKQKD